MNKIELKEKIESVEITYDYESVYCDLRNACIDYMNDTQDWELDYLFEEYTDSEIVAMEIERIAKEHDLDRLYCFLGDTDIREEIFRINAYGNLENIQKDDLEYLKEEILKQISEDEERESEE